ncbi:MAG: hypothetical protein ACXAC5_16050 [Promethearchaeota archaeon]
MESSSCHKCLQRRMPRACSKIPSNGEVPFDPSWIFSVVSCFYEAPRNTSDYRRCLSFQGANWYLPMKPLNISMSSLASKASLNLRV